MRKNVGGRTVFPRLFLKGSEVKGKDERRK